MMTWPELLQGGVTLLGVFGGAGVVANAVANRVVDHKSKTWLQNHQGALDRQLADHRAELEGEADKRRLAHRRQELMVEREFEAAQAVAHLVDAALEQFAGPDADDPDIYKASVAGEFGKFEKKISELLRRHESALSEQTVSLLACARHQAKVGGYSYAIDSGGHETPDFEISQTTASHTDKFVQAITQARQGARQDLKIGTLTKLD